ncbi:hypothetical protein [Catellatospora sp. NPDC049609]|uniref:hypothetical protein n=1 Tax=Catellatospora sp. NPDC049609 TaxID=3155505 RepID=UPI0034386A1D
MEFVVGLLVVTVALIAVMLFVVARRSRSRSKLDPSRDVYRGYPEDKTLNPYSVHPDGTHNPGGGGGSF